MVDARANRAGQKAVAENKERAEREARLIELFKEQKEVRGDLLLPQQHLVDKLSVTDQCTYSVKGLHCCMPLGKVALRLQSMMTTTPVITPDIRHDT
jgi:hypothetical protein